MLKELGLIIFALAVSLPQDSAQDGSSWSELPSIWPAIRADKSYHLIYQLEVRQILQHINVEEWASLDRKLLRLDIITSEQRTSYLFKGETGEIFGYKPFVCDTLAPDSPELDIIAHPFKGHRLRPNDTIYGYGLGALWLQAMEDSSKIQRLQYNSLKRNQESKIDRVKGLDCYKWVYDADSSTSIRLYFKHDLPNRFVDAIEWTSSENSTSKNVNARAKLLFFDIRPIDDQVFEIPLGYGCERAENFELSIDPDTLDNLSLELLHEGIPNEVLLDITTSAVRDSQLNKWASRRYTTRLMRAALEMNGYLRVYSAVSVQSQSTKDGKPHRVRHIWSTYENVSQPLVYVIDDISHTCQMNRKTMDNVFRVPFPDISEMKDPEDESISMGLSLINWLFMDKEDFHLIRERSTDSEYEIIFEKRLKTLKLTDDLWTGPVSIVKKLRRYHSSFEPLQLDPSILSQSEEFYQTIDLFFYSDKQDRILNKAKLEYLESNEVGINFIHRQLGISDCFGQQSKQNLIFKYPLESRQPPIDLQKGSDLIRELFLLNIFSTTTIEPQQISKVELSYDNYFIHIEMQLLDLPLTHAYQFIQGKQLQMKSDAEPARPVKALLTKAASNADSCALACEQYNCPRFTFDWLELRCRIELLANVAKAYNDTSSSLYSRVQLPLNLPAWTKSVDSVVGQGVVHLRPRALLAVFRKLIEYGPDEDSNEPFPLIIQIPYKWNIMDNEMERERLDAMINGITEAQSGSKYDDFDGFKLVPEVVLSDMDSMKELNTISDNDEPGLPPGGGNSLSIQYSVVLEGRRFHNGLEGSIEQLDEISYEECARSCENTDCRSFSYCEPSQLCRISTSLSSITELQAATVTMSGCDLFAPDHLSKFENFGLATPPAQTGRLIKKLQVLDCAQACLEESEFTCQGFYLCQRSRSCFLNDRHLDDLVGLDDVSSRDLIVGTLANKSSSSSLAYQAVGGSDEPQMCQLYSRSYLTHFDQYYGRALDFSKIKSDYIQFRGLGAERCAHRCIGNRCLAFHVCRVRSLSHCVVARDRGLKRSQVGQRSHCSLYTLSDGSLFSRLVRNLSDELGVPDRSADKSQEASTEQSQLVDPAQQAAIENDLNRDLFELLEKFGPRKIIGRASWPSKIVSLLLGLLSGVGCALVWKRSDSISTFVVGLRDRLRGHF